MTRGDHTDNALRGLYELRPKIPCDAWESFRQRSNFFQSSERPGSNGSQDPDENDQNQGCDQYIYQWWNHLFCHNYT
jgi:hypothetical protein